MATTRFTILIAFVFVALLAGQNTNADAVQAISSALRAKAFSRALELVTTALKTRPGDIRLLSLEAITFLNLGDDSKALDAFNRALAIAPGYLAALQGAAQIEYKRGTDRAVTLLDRILAVQPQEQTAHAMLAALQWKRGDCRSAVEHFGQSAAVIESQPAALTQYGMCLVRLDQFPPAIAVFEKVRTLDPANARTALQLASVHLMAGHTEAAVKALQPLIEANNAEALALASSAYEAAGDTPAAVRLLREAIVQAPDEIQYYLDFASISFTHSSHQTGIEIINAGLARMPDSPQLHLARGVLYVQLGELDKADADFTIAERFDPRQTTSSVARVLTKYQQSDTDQALSMIEKQLKDNPKDGFLYYLQAEILSAQGHQPGSVEFQKAIKGAQRAVELQPKLVLARNVLSRLYLEAGQVTDSMEQCRLALAEDPLDEVALYRLIRASRMTGKAEDAARIPELMKQFSETREKLKQREAQKSKYRLFVGEAEPQ